MLTIKPDHFSGACDRIGCAAHSRFDRTREPDCLLGADRYRFALIPASCGYLLEEAACMVGVDHTQGTEACDQGLDRNAPMLLDPSERLQSHAATQSTKFLKHRVTRC